MQVLFMYPTFYAVHGLYCIYSSLAMQRAVCGLQARLSNKLETTLVQFGKQDEDIFEQESLSTNDLGCVFIS